MPSYASTDNQQAFRCPRCDGSGKVTIGKDDQEREVDCSICGGSGRVTAARMAGYQGTPDAVQNDPPREPEDIEGNDSNSSSSPSEDTNKTLFESLTDENKALQSSAVKDILRGSSELPPEWNDDEFQELMHQSLVVCPRCSGMKQVFLKGKRSYCPICRGIGVTSIKEATKWRQEAGGGNNDRFAPRS